MAGTGRRNYMRIVGGVWRSRRLRAPETDATRPMPDRVRESIFDTLASRLTLPGLVPAFAVADMFAGSGSMGLEAVSRGAARCDFFETGRKAMQTLRDNLNTLQAGAGCRLVGVDAWTAPLMTPRPDEAYGLIFVDPPYRDARDSSRTGKVSALLSDVCRAGWADDETIVVLHHEARAEYEPGDRAPWSVVDRRVYGKAAVTYVMRRSREADDLPADVGSADDS